MSSRSSIDKSRIHRYRNFGAAQDDVVAPRAVLELDGKALQNNYKAICDLVPDQAILPMVKADAYGHGADWAAGLLTGFSRLFGFGVATLEEGAALRAVLGVRGRRIRIVVFSGAIPWTEQKGHYCETHGLTPVIADDDDWKAFVTQQWPGRISYQIKFNTGMNRLGLSPSMVRVVIKGLQGLPPEAHPEAVLTHMAMSETPDSRLSQMQLERFIAIKSELTTAFPATLFHLANSGAIWNQKRFGLSGLTDIVRPGLALYGVAPWADAPSRGLLPVMTFKARVVAHHLLKPGESIGYGATYKVSSKATETVSAAILSAGYADGIQRMLSNQGYAWLNGRSTRFLGMVSMDLSAVVAVPFTRVGDMAEIIGPHVDLWAQSRAAGTIPYELLTSLSARVQRTYV
ncbi:alanine racemase [Bdellovibrionota bacterium FG-1]